jgi:S-ribosylhomocysteine lyase LuxS involved in autoinducer biosynthesis
MEINGENITQIEQRFAAMSNEELVNEINVHAQEVQIASRLRDLGIAERVIRVVQNTEPMDPWTIREAQDGQ